MPSSRELRWDTSLFKARLHLGDCHQRLSGLTFSNLVHVTVYRLLRAILGEATEVLHHKAEICLYGFCGQKKKRLSQLAGKQIVCVWTAKTCAHLWRPLPSLLLQLSISRQQIGTFSHKIVSQNFSFRLDSCNLDQHVKAAYNIDETWNHLPKQTHENLLEKTKRGCVLTSKSEETDN